MIVLEFSELVLGALPRTAYRGLARGWNKVHCVPFANEASRDQRYEHKSAPAPLL